MGFLKEGLDGKKPKRTWYRTIFFPDTPDGRTICCLHVTIYTLLFMMVLAPIMLYQVADMGINVLVAEDGKDAPSYDAWQTNMKGDARKDLKIHYDLYFFDIQNPEAALTGEKMVVVEKGPYAFRKYYNKFDISWSDHGDKVTYNTQTQFHFDESLTDPGLSLDDLLTLVYPTIVSFEFALRGIDVPREFKIGINELLTQKYNAVITDVSHYRNETDCPQVGGDAQCRAANNALRQLNELKALTRTYTDRLSNFADAMRAIYCKYGPNGMSPWWKVTPIDAYFGYLNDPVLVGLNELLWASGIEELQTFGNMSTAVPGLTSNYTSVADARRRRTPDVMYTGKQDPRKVGRFVRAYNMSGEQWICFSPNTTQDGYVPGENFPACDHFQAEWTYDDAKAESMGYGQGWSDSYSNRIAGSDGVSYGRPVTDPKVSMYISDIYRSVYAEHKSTPSDWHGIPLRRYGLQQKDLQNASINPENAAYYQFAPYGLLNLTKAGDNLVSLWASKPHFLDGDPRLVSAVSGMSPRDAAHQTFLDVEPNTGLLARAHKRLQLAYKVFDFTYTSVSGASVNTWESLCTDLETIDMAGAVCTEHDEKFLLCMSKPADWKYYRDDTDGLYVPTAWADEHVEMNDETADGLKTGLFAVYDLADAIFFWCPTFAVLIFVALLYNIKALESDERTSDFDEKEAGATALLNPLLNGI